MAQAQQAGQPNREQPKKSLRKASNEVHVAKTQYGMGDNYGTGVRAKLGRMREGTGMEQLSKSKLKTLPKALA